MLATVLNDVRYALRGFTRRPTFTVVVVATLAVGIGANVAVFSLFDRLLLEQLPVSHPTELVNLTSAGPKGNGLTMCNAQGNCDEVFSYPMFRDLERVEGPFSGLAGSRLIATNLSVGGRTIQGSAVLVSGNYFGVLGVGAALGRVLDEQDDRVPGEASVAVLSYAYWQSALGGDAGAVGKTIRVNGQPLTIVGVAPRGFFGTTVGERPQVFVPITFNWFNVPGIPPVHGSRFAYWVYVFGRLKPDVSIERAQATVNGPYRAIIDSSEAAGSGLQAEKLAEFRNKTLELKPGARGQSGAPRAARTPLAVFIAATATILLIACVNLANLLFARGVVRTGEMAVRTSLGATRARLVGMQTVEALLLATFAAGASLPIASGVLQAVGALVPPHLLAISDLTLDPLAVAAAFAIGAVATVLFALVPMLKLAATEAAPALAANGAAVAGGKALGRFRFALSTSEIALSMLLLVLAILFTQSLANIARVDLGMRTESVVTFGVAPSSNGYPAERSAQLIDEIERRLDAQPDVVSVTSSMVPLLSSSAWGASVTIEGHEPPASGKTSTNVNYVGSGFLGTLDIPLLAGRDIDDGDGADRPLVAVVNQSFAKKYALGRNPIGRHIETGGKGGIEIVGLFRDAAYNRVKEPFAPEFMLPRRQWPQSSAQGMSFYVRVAQSTDVLLAAIPRIVAQVDPDLPATNVQTLSTQVRKNVQTDWLLVALAGTLATVATALAAIGLYGVLSYTVTQRTREIGVRLALGAEPGRVRALVMRDVAWMCAIGGALGFAGALLLGRLAAALLFGLSPTDPAAFAAAAALLGIVVISASYLPARRASRVDPVVALRSE